jgi:ABC-2 type transport system permease protein
VAGDLREGGEEAGVTASVPDPTSRHGLELKNPGGTGSFGELVRYRFLLRLLVRKEVQVRYQGTVLGMAWSYVKPLVRFFVYFFVIGVVLGLSREIPNYGVHIVAAMTMVHYFNEIFSSATNSVLRNKALVRKIYLPRELFPVASVFVSMVNIVPGMVVLAGAALLTGWHPEWESVPAMLLGFLLVTVFGMAVGLLFSGFNVYFRDFAKVVDVITVLVPWSVPMIYAYDMIGTRLEDYRWLLEIYLANPVAIAGMLFQRAFWVPTVDQGQVTNPAVLELAPDLFARGVILLLVSVVLVVVAQRVFGRLEGNFAEQL